MYENKISSQTKGMGSPIEVRDRSSSEIQTLVNQIANRIESLHERVSILSDLLQPVLGPSSPEASQGVDTPHPASLLGQTLQNQLEGLEILETRLVDLHIRLCL